MVAAPTPKMSRGEVWLVNFDPAVGAEIQKLRPALVVSRASVGRLPLRLVVPITDWKLNYVSYPWFVHLPANLQNGLTKDSAADAFQVKSVSVDRFRRQIGNVTILQVDAVANAIALCVAVR